MDFRPCIALAIIASLFITSDCTFILESGTAASTGLTISSGSAAAAVGAAGVAALVLGAGVVLALAASRRGKRDVASKDELIFDVISAADTLGCALKLVCLLEAKSDDQINEDDAFILTLFGRNPEPVSLENLRSNRGPYDYAAYMGATFGKDACNKIFHTCPHSYGDMISYVHLLRQE